MYFINPSLHISTLTLIELLYDAGYIIDTDESNIIIKFEGKIDTISKNTVKVYLRNTNNKVYKYYIKQLEQHVDIVSNRYFKELNEIGFNSTQELIDRLIYHKGIYLLIKKDKNVINIVNHYIKQKNLNET